jgi:hypothetical protein
VPWSQYRPQTVQILIQSVEGALRKAKQLLATVEAEKGFVPPEIVSQNRAADAVNPKRMNWWRRKAMNEKAAATQQEIMDVCQDIMRANPGMTFSTAYNLVMQKRPDLFKEATGEDPIARLEKEDTVRKKQAAIHEEIEKMRERDPHLTFLVAFNLLMAKKPELFDFEGLD